MHEKIKDFLHKTGTTHAPEHALSEVDGQHHTDLHTIESKHMEGKKHHHDMDI